MIDVTGVDLVALVKAAYDLSVPQGLGFLHATPEPLTDEEALKWIRPSYGCALSLDYVKGRAVKLSVREDEQGRRTIPSAWFDHSDAQLRELLTRVGRSEEATKVGAVAGDVA